MKADDIVKYDYLKVKPYDVRVQEEAEGTSYILSFSDSHHVKVSETAKTIIDLFDGKHTLIEIENSLQSKGIKISDSDLKKIVQEILMDKAMLEGIPFKNKKKNSLLWIKIPLLDSWKLNKLFSVLKYAFEKHLLMIGMFCIFFSIVISAYMILTIEKEYPLNSIFIMIIGYISLVIHEFGHASAAYKYKINVGKIGIGMYFLCPVMYIDMTSAWRLASKQRVLIDFGGMYFQALTAIPLTIIGMISKNNLFYVCSIYVLAMSIYNLLPFLKLDGYWLLCDYFELNNLSQNAFKTIRDQIGNKNDKLTKKKKVYYIFSLIYSISIIFMFCIGIIYFIITIRNWDYVIETGKEFIFALQNNNVKGMFATINSILIYILPVIFITVMAVKGFLKYFMGKRNRKVCSRFDRGAINE